MAAVTVSSIIQESVGSLKLHIASIAAGASTLDTWASGIPGIVGAWANCSSASNTATNANGIEVLITSSTLYFRADTNAETLSQITCYVISKS